MSKPTTAIILAAGRGKRLEEYTEGRPKCLVPMGGKPLLSWQCSALKAAGIRRLVAVCGYRSDDIAATGIETIINHDWATTNMVASLLTARHLLDGPVIISYSDIVYRPDIVQRLAQAPEALAISYDHAWLELWQQRFDEPLTDAETFRLDGNGRVADIGRKASSVTEIEGQYMGLLKFAPPALEWVDTVLANERDPATRARMDMTTLLSRLISAAYPIGAVGISGGWCEIDSPRDLAVAEALVASGRLAAE